MSLVKTDQLTDTAGTNMPKFTGITVSRIKVTDATNNLGSTNTVVKRFATTEFSTGSAVTGADSSTNGYAFTIAEDGIYAIRFGATAGDANAVGIQITKNSTTAVQQNSASLLARSTGVSGTNMTVNYVGRLASSDVIRALTNGGFVFDTSCFEIIQLARL